MKKVRKGKKMLILISIAIILIIIVTLIVIKVIHKNDNTPDITGETAEQPVFQLPETTYGEMQVKNIQMEYLKDNDETMVTMTIDNTTSDKVKDEKFNAILIGPDENVLGQMETLITKLDPNEQYNVSVVLKGDLTSTQQIKLEKK